MSSGQPNSPHLPRTGRLVAGLLCVCLVVYCLLVAIPLVKGVPPIVAVFAGSLLMSALSLAFVGLGAMLRVGLIEEILLTALFVMAWLDCAEAAAFFPEARVYTSALGTVLFLPACLFAGRLLSRVVRERGMTLPVCIVAALADIFTVFWGPTGQALERAPEVVQKLSLAIPAAGSAVGVHGAKGLAFVATMGLGDFIFLALFMSLAVRFGFPLWRTLGAVMVGALVGVVLALANPFGLPGMPLLPYMAAAFLAANARSFALSAQEKRDTAIALVVLVVLFAAAGLALHYPQGP